MTDRLGIPWAPEGVRVAVEAARAVGAHIAVQPPLPVEVGSIAVWLPREHERLGVALVLAGFKRGAEADDLFPGCAYGWWEP